MAVLWHVLAADSAAQWRGPIPMAADERALLDSIGRGRAAVTAPGAAAGPAAAPVDKDLPPLSVGQLLSIGSVRGMLLMAIVQVRLARPARHPWRGGRTHRTE
jgi:hypothetical protein